MIRNRLKKMAKRLLGRSDEAQRSPIGAARPVAPTPKPSAPPAPQRELDLDLDDDHEEVDLEVDSAVIRDWTSEGRPWLFVDIREIPEMRAGHVVDAHLMPMGDVAQRQGELPKDRAVVVYCASGGRSFQIAHYLREQGFEDAWSFVGGMGSWLASGGEQLIAPEDAAFGPGADAVLSPEAIERLGRQDQTNTGTIQEVRDTPEGHRYVLGLAKEGGLERLADLGADDLVKP